MTTENTVDSVDKVTLTAAQKQSKSLEKHIPAIKAWMEENVKGDVGVDAKDIYAALNESEKFAMSPSSFQVVLSNSFKAGALTGFFGVRGRGGGYFPESKRAELLAAKEAKLAAKSEKKRKVRPAADADKAE